MSAAPIPVPVPTPTPAPVVNWYDGQDPDFVGQLTNRGLTGKTPVEAALEFHKAHREAEKFIGIPADQLVRMPKDPADAEGWKNVHTKLGVPADPKEYDFTSIKFKDGTDLDPAFTDWFRAAAAENHLPKTAAVALAGKFTAFLDQQDTTEAASTAATLLAQKAELQTNWGANHAANLLVAQGAARALGVEPATVAALETVVGYAKIMEMFRNIGSKIGEDKFVSSSGSGTPGIMSRDQAVSEKVTLMADKAFVAKYLAGDIAAGKQMKSLEYIIAGMVPPA